LIFNFVLPDITPPSLVRLLLGAATVCSSDLRSFAERLIDLEADRFFALDVIQALKQGALRDDHDPLPVLRAALCLSTPMGRTNVEVPT